LLPPALLLLLLLEAALHHDAAEWPQALLAELAPSMSLTGLAVALLRRGRQHDCNMTAAAAAAAAAATVS
jgi:hypothetical protein